MAIAEHQDLATYCRSVALQARAAARQLQLAGGAQKNAWLRRAAEQLRAGVADILRANARDLQAATENELSDAQIDRLRLTPERVAAIAAGLEQIAYLPDPVGEVIESAVRPNGLQISKVRVPLGVVFFIYEARPNVTADAAAICLKSGNAVILRGGKEAVHSSQAIMDVLVQAAQAGGLPAHAMQLVATADREAVGHFLKMNDAIDVAIPRGGEGLIRRVAADARMPVIKHFTGNCHVYVDSAADLQQALAVCINSKCQRLGVCNACESLLVHQDIAEPFLPRVIRELQQQGVQVRGDKRVQSLADGVVAAEEQDYFTEYLDAIISVKVVADLEQAIAHINHYGSHHTDAIITTDLRAARRFTAAVDSAAVIVNASTRFHDGGEFGLGAEIGISTDKFHARGPCGLRELTSYKYVVYGDGHVR
jgi:glutamate-5-semialdehyde dehydrogenase